VSNFKVKAIFSNVKRFTIPLTIHELNASMYGPKVLANSFPKSGTHLLLQILSLLPLLAPRWRYHLNNDTPKLLPKIHKICKGQYVSGHLYWSQELIESIRTTNIRPLFIIRDLRDLAVSNFYYITYKEPNHRLHSYFKSLNSDAERLMASIVGIDGKLLKDGIRSKSMGEHAIAYAPWLNEPTCLTVRFEDLVGSNGGGSDEKQMKTIRAITDHLGIDMSEEQIDRIASKAFFKKSSTFRKGQIGDWKNHFTDEHQRAFKEVAGEALLKLGYYDN
jgi:hypothetical protein